MLHVDTVLELVHHVVDAIFQERPTESWLVFHDLYDVASAEITAFSRFT